MNTGEYPNPKSASVDERTTFSWPVMVVVATACLAIGAAHWRLQTVDAALTKHLDTTAEMLRTDNQHEVRLTRLEDSFSRVEKALERIDRKIDRLTEGEVRPAGGKR